VTFKRLKTLGDYASRKSPTSHCRPADHVWLMANIAVDWSERCLVPCFHPTKSLWLSKYPCKQRSPFIHPLLVGTGHRQVHVLP